MSSKKKNNHKKKPQAPAKKPEKKRSNLLVITLICIGVVVALFLGSKVFTTFTSGSGDPSSGRSPSYITTADLDPNLIYYADIEMENYGTIIVQLDQNAAPVTASNFVKLAESGFYNGLTFHRIMERFMMQGGCPEGTGYGGSDNMIYGEFAENGFDNPLSHTRGTISMARSSDYNSARSQFFIMHQSDYVSSLDGKYAAFGHVIEGMDIVDAICESARPIDSNGRIAAEDQPVIISITIRTAPAEQ